MARRSTKVMHPTFVEILRLTKCKTITDLSKKTGIPVTTLRKYAYEGLFPEAWTIAIKLAKAADIKVDDLLTGLLHEEKKIAS